MAGHIKKPKDSKPNVIEPKAEPIKELPVFTPDGVALTIIKKGDKYHIYKVAIDSDSGLAGAVELIDTADGKFEANEKFKLNVVRFGII